MATFMLQSPPVTAVLLAGGGGRWEMISGRVSLPARLAHGPGAAAAAAAATRSPVVQGISVPACLTHALRPPLSLSTYSRLYPLNASGTPKVLLPVANRPLLSFPLRMLEESGLADVLVVRGTPRRTAAKRPRAVHTAVTHRAGMRSSCAGQEPASSGRPAGQHARRLTQPPCLGRPSRLSRVACTPPRTLDPFRAGGGAR